MHTLPALVSKLTHAHDAWIVGSAAYPKCDLSTVRDFDVLVPLPQWQGASMLVPMSARPNTFGGWKCIDEGKEVDMWPGELSWIMTNSKSSWAWHPKTGVYITKWTNP